MIDDDDYNEDEDDDDGVCDRIWQKYHRAEISRSQRQRRAFSDFVPCLIAKTFEKSEPDTFQSSQVQLTTMYAPTLFGFNNNHKK